MRMLMRATMPNEKFNAAIRDGSVGKKMARIMEAIKPEAAYFTEFDGNRTTIMIVNVDDPSKIPAVGEPLFLTFDAEVEFHIVMSPEELGRAGLEEIGRKWA